MENKEIIEGNRLIAEFMQLTRLTETTYINPVMASSTDMLLYNENWGWLMPVIEKISKYQYKNDSWRNCEPYEDYAYPRTFGMLNTEGKPMVRINASALFVADTLIEAAWLAVVDFIKWYNSINQKGE